MKKNFSTFFAFVCFVLLIFCIGVSYEAKPLHENSDILRFHIVANSDSAQDQALKYTVRDGISTLLNDVFGECDSVQEAFDAAEKNKTVIEKTAKQILEKSQSDQTAQVLLGRETHPEKTFGGRVFPEGEYLSLRIVLGEGKGQNWWCVLFPRLCPAGIEYKEEETEPSGAVEIFGCRVRLKILDYLK